jgi:hypothetical protein
VPTQAEAIALGARAVTRGGHAAQATFKVVPSTKFVVPTRVSPVSPKAFAEMFRPPKSKAPMTFVQKKYKRINTLTEPGKSCYTKYRERIPLIMWN